jgi:hypothetical protein
MNPFAKIDITTTEARKLVFTGFDGKPLVEDELKAPFVKLIGQDNQIFRDATKKLDNEGANYDLELLAHCVAEWGNITNEQGQELPLTIENAVTFFKRYPVLKGQASMFLLNQENYLKKSLEV